MIIDRVVNETTNRVVNTATAGQIPDIPFLWNIVNRNDYLSKRVNSFAINTLINSAPHRPYPFSLLIGLHHLAVTDRPHLYLPAPGPRQ